MRLPPWIVVLLTWVTLLASPAWACAVCGFGEDATTDVFFYSTIALSLIPLGMIGGLIYWIYRRTQGEPPAEDTSLSA